MSASSTIVAVLKKKMLETREEVDKVKENIDDMTKKIQVKV